jgi:hypothetical protein
MDSGQRQWLSSPELTLPSGYGHGGLPVVGETLGGLPPSLPPSLGCMTSWCAVPAALVLCLMGEDNNRQVADAAEFQQKLEAMVAAAEDAKKKAAAACTWVLTAVALLEQEQRGAATLDEAAQAAVRLIKAPIPPSTLAPGSSSSLNADDYKAAVITNLHVQASSIQNIHSLVSVVLDSSSTHYDHWRDNVLLTLWRYALSDHVLS